MFFEYLLMQWGILLLVSSPLLIVYFNRKKKGIVRSIYVSIPNPNGPQRVKVDGLGFPWPVFWFNKWGMMFRGQMAEGFFWLMTILLLQITMPLFGVDKFTENTVHTVETINWWFFGITVAVNAIFSYFYVIYADQMKLKMLHMRGFRYDDPENGDVEALYKWIGLPVPRNIEETPDIKQGTDHNYVVPEQPKEEASDTFRYEKLTMADLKLLLKSEGIPFTPEDSHDQLVELANQYLKEEETEKSRYDSMIVAELVEELQNRKIPLNQSMNRDQLIELLEEDDSKK